MSTMKSMLGEVRKNLKIYHVNLLKKWRSRQEVVMFCHTTPPLEDELEFHPEVTAGKETWKDVIVSDDIPADQKQKISDLLSEYSDVFSDKPSITNAAVHRIETCEERPIRCTPYRIPHSLKEKFKGELDEMLQLDIVKKSNSEWASPVVIVPKKDADGNQTGIRVCIDYRKVNAVTRFDAYPLPRMEDLIENLTSAKFITKLDMTKGYWQIPLGVDSRKKSAFITPYGLYEFQVMPFGMMTAPATFQRMMAKVLSGTEQFAGAYLDDVIISSKSFDEHVAHLQAVLDRLRQAKLVANPSKCVVGHAEIQYLGHLVGAGEMRPLDSKVEAVRQYAKPETKKQLRAFLGLCGYYRKFVQNFADIAAPLTDQTGKKYPNKIKWTSECEKSFSQLKLALCSKPVLQLPDFSKPFVVQVDASERGLGAILCQKDDHGDEHPIVFCSRKLLDRERTLATTEKECLGLVWAIQLLRPYLFGYPFVVETDHNALVWLYKVKDTNQKLLRWSLILQQYNFTVKHKRGKDNANADALSRT